MKNWLKTRGIWIKNNLITSIIIVVWLIIGLVAFIWHWVTYDGISWVVLSGVATWILALGVFLAIIQIREARRSTNAQLAIELFKDLRSPKAIRRLQDIYSEKPEYFTKSNYNVRVNEIDSILDSLGMVGTLIAYGILDEKMAIEGFGGVTVLRCWYQLGDYIKELRKQRGQRFSNYVEDFASRSLKYWKKRPKSDWILFVNGESVKPFNLVEKLDKYDKIRPKSINEIKQ